MRIRPFKVCDQPIAAGWIPNARQFSMWSADLLRYPLDATQLEALRLEYEAMENGWLFTALDAAGRPVGMFMMRNADYEKNSVHMGFILVDPARRGQGFGKAMVRLAARYAFELLGAERLTLRVMDSNEPAHRCYLGLGFFDEAHEERCFTHGDEIWGWFHMALTPDRLRLK